MLKVYMDHAAATPLDKRVFAAMTPYLTTIFGNPASLHAWGEQAKSGLDKAREQVAALIGAEPEEVIFTASGSEANNLAIKGLAGARVKQGKHIIISNIEHFSVMHSAKQLEKDGYEITYIPVDSEALVDPADVEKAIRPDTILISITFANGEVGTIQPIKEIAALAATHDIVMHTDAVAAAGSIPIDVRELGVTALSLAADQFYGPKGAAALFVKKRNRIKPLIDGGIQEGGKRAGTENVPAIVGMGVAAELAAEEMEERAARLIPLRDRLMEQLTAGIPHSVVNGHRELRLPGNVHIRIEYIEGESMLIMLGMQGIAAASGSACASKALKASHVLTAMGIPHEKVHGSLLFSLGVENTVEEVDYVSKALPPIVERLRAMSPMTPEKESK